MLGSGTNSDRGRDIWSKDSMTLLLISLARHEQSRVSDERQCVRFDLNASHELWE